MRNVLCCTVANAIESLMVDGFLDLPQIVRQLQIYRPAFITTLLSFDHSMKWIYNVVD